jgi:hypothetical protein
MKFIKDFFDIIYKEDNSILNLSISIAGIISLVAYFFTSELLLIFFVFITAFPLLKEGFKTMREFIKIRIDKNKDIPVSKINLTDVEKNVCVIFVYNGILQLPDNWFTQHQENIINSLIVKEYVKKVHRGYYSGLEVFAYILHQEVFDFVRDNMEDFEPINDKCVSNLEKSEKLVQMGLLDMIDD